MYGSGTYVTIASLRAIGVRIGGKIGVMRVATSFTLSVFMGVSVVMVGAKAIVLVIIMGIDRHTRRNGCCYG